MKLSQIKEIEDNIEKGYRFQIYPGSNIYATVIPYNDIRHQNNFAALCQIWHRKNEGEKITEEVVEDLRAKAMIATCILDIDGLENEDGTEKKWSLDEGMKIMDEGHFKFFKTIFDYVDNLTLKSTPYIVNEDTKKKPSDT